MTSFALRYVYRSHHRCTFVHFRVQVLRLPASFVADTLKNRWMTKSCFITRLYVCLSLWFNRMSFNMAILICVCSKPTLWRSTELTELSHRFVYMYVMNGWREPNTEFRCFALVASVHVIGDLLECLIIVTNQKANTR